MAPVANDDDQEMEPSRIGSRDSAYGGYGAAPQNFSGVGGAPGTPNNAAITALQIPRGPGGASPQPPYLVREQARDGNCLFRSFSDQLYGTPEHHALVRDRCSKYIASERNYFEQFVTEPFDEFLTRMRREGEWGDDVEIEALSEIYDCRVEIYASYSHTLLRTFHETCDAKRPHPIRLQYEGHAHYNSLAPRSGLRAIAKSLPGQPPCSPGEIEDAAIARSRKRQEAGLRRQGAAEVDADQTDREVLDESIRLSRQEFEHKSEAEMDQTLQNSRVEWERSERKRMDEEVVDAILQQSVLEEEQKQLAVAMKESKEMIMTQSKADCAAFYPMFGTNDHANAARAAHDLPAASSSSGNEPDTREMGDYQYPESVYNVMSMGFPLEKCIQAYHLVGDNPEGILAYCCQTLGR